MKFSRKDLMFCVIAGMTTGIIGWRIFVYVGAKNILGIFNPLGNGYAPIIVSPLWLIIIIPIAWIVGVNLGYFLGRWMAFFNQFGKFAAIGFTNFAVDSGVLYLLIAFSGINAGLWYTLFKSVSFLVGITHSYIYNRFWVFESGKSSNVGQEFSKFLSVGLVSFFVNVGVASAVVILIPPLFGITSVRWAGVGAIAGSAIALLLSFVGFKFLVFKPKNASNPIPQIPSQSF
jgi:putative flippase GtrA